MAYIVWSEFFSVNIPYIDQQHIKLFDIINDFYSDVKSNQPKDVIFRTLNELTLYCEKHFRDEEEMLREIKYTEKEFQLHKKYHEKLLNDIFYLTELLENKEEDFLYKLETFLNGWIIQHILFQDKKYEAFYYKEKIKK